MQEPVVVDVAAVDLLVRVTVVVESRVAAADVVEWWLLKGCCCYREEASLGCCGPRASCLPS